MDYTKTIHDFLDGSLEASGEEEFFLNLANNEELRSELKQQLAMKEAIKSDTKAFTPSAASTMAIFSALGFSAATTAAAQTAGIGHKAKSLLTNYKQGLIGGVMSAAATIAIIFLLFNPMQNTAENDLPSKGANYTGMHSAKEDLDVSIPRVVSKSVDSKEPQVIIKYVDSSKEQIAANNYDEKISGERKTGFSNYLKYSDHEIIRTKPVLNYENQASLQDESIIPATYLSDDQSVNSGFSLEVRGSQDWLLNDVNIAPAKFPKFNNMSLTALYSITDDLQAGIDIRQENFYQEFTGYDKKQKKIYSIQQQPNFTSAGIALRYTWNDDGLIPVINQVTLSGTSAGMIGRFMIGSKYSPYHNISFILGLEYSILRYFHQDQYFASPKIGLKYGVSYKL